MYEEILNVSCSGMAQGTPPDPCTVVIYGVAGDLGRTTLIPSLYGLHVQGLLPEPISIIGVARRDWHDETFRQEMRRYVQDKKYFRPDTWEQFAGCLRRTMPPCVQHLSGSAPQTIFRTMSCFTCRRRRVSTVQLSTNSRQHRSWEAIRAGAGSSLKSPSVTTKPPPVSWTASCSR
jgi:hypothetical protein